MVKHNIILLLISLLFNPVYSQDIKNSSYPALKNISVKRRTITDNPVFSQKQYGSLMANQTAKQQLDSIIEYNFNESTNSWDKKFVKDTYTYDYDLNETHRVYSSWNEADNGWNNLMKEDSHYDVLGNIAGYASSVWVNGQWKKERKEEYTYNDKNELTETLIYAWKYNLHDWLLAEKLSYSYDENGKLLKDSLYWWHETSQVWVLKEKVDYEYINDKLHYVIKSKWIENVAKWIYDKKEWYLYDNIKWLLYTISGYVWDESVEDWNLKTKEGFSYNDEDYVNTYSKVSRDLESGVWNSLQSEHYTFDYAVNSDELILPYLINTYDVFYFHHKVTSKKQSSYNFDTKQYEQFREIKYYYSPVDEILSIGGNDIEPESINIYPNPARDYVNIHLAGSNKQGIFELFDNKARKVLTTPLSDGKTISTSFLKPGIYIYHVIIDQKIETGKLVIDAN